MANNVNVFRCHLCHAKSCLTKLLRQWIPELYEACCDPVVVRRILSDTKAFVKGKDYSEVFGYIFGEGLVTSSGEKHKKDRSLFGKYFVKTNIMKYVGMINAECAEGIVEKIESKLAVGEKSFNMEKFFAVMALRCFSNFSMNTNLKHEPKLEEELCHISSQTSAAVARMILFNLPLWSFIPHVKTMDKFVKCVSDCMLPIVEARRSAIARGESGEVDDCLSIMISENLSHKEMVDHVCTLIGAGHDTTAFFASYVAFVLATYPEIQEKLRAEVMKQVGDKEVITADDVFEMRYMAMVMQETLRYYAVIPTLTRDTVEDVCIKEAGITIPKGTKCMIPLFLMNRDPTVWENPSQFIPERFVDKPNEAFTSAKNGFFPFAYGSRTCIGNVLAQIETGIFMCQLLKKFRFVPKPGFKLHIESGISLTTSNGVFVDIEKLEG